MFVSDKTNVNLELLFELNEIFSLDAIQARGLDGFNYGLTDGLTMPLVHIQSAASGLSGHVVLADSKSNSINYFRETVSTVENDGLSDLETSGLTN